MTQNISTEELYKIDSLEINGLQRKYKITVSENNFKNAFDHKLSKAQVNMVIKGFRRGHVPRHVVLENYGNQMFEETCNEMLEGGCNYLVKSLGENVCSLKYEDISDKTLPEYTSKRGPEGDFSYVIEIEVLPDINLKAPEDLFIEELKVAFSDDDYQEYENSFRDKALIYEDSGTDAQVEKGDRVEVDFEGKIGDKLMKGGTAKGQKIDVGAGKFLPDFENSLYNKKVGEKFFVNVNFPENYSEKSYAGKMAIFEISINKLSKGRKSQTDEEFAQAMGVKSYDILKIRLKKSMNDDVEYMIASLARKELFNAAIGDQDFPVPKSLLKTEIDNMHADHDHSECDESAHEEDEKKCLKKVRLGLLLKSYGEKYDVEAKESDVINFVTQRYGDSIGVDKILDALRKNRDLYASCYAQALELKITDYLIHSASKKQREISYSELKDLYDEINK